MNFPEDLKYTRDHEWIRIDGSVAYIGITDFAQSELGDIVYVDIDCEGRPLIKTRSLGSVEAVKTVSDLYMPVDGTVLEINTKLEDDAELVNTDPYGEGWMVKIEFSDASQLDDLFDVNSYRESIEA